MDEVIPGDVPETINGNSCPDHGKTSGHPGADRGGTRRFAEAKVRACKAPGFRRMWRFGEREGKRTEMKGKKCVFLDRDGIVNAPPGEERYVRKAEDFVLQPAFPAVLREIAGAGFEAIVVTNQRGVALGLMTIEDVAGIHGRLADILREEHGLSLLDVMCCPHDRGECECRKPKPGMLLAAAARHGIDLSASWMVGDQERDIEAGRRAGCRTILVEAADAVTAADYKVRDLTELAALLRRVLRNGA
jgi:histidinol-phosphate phosphatase family protein